MLEISAILGLVLVLSAFAQSPPDYSNPYSPIFTDQDVYTWTDKVYITILAPSWNANRDGIDSIGEDEEHFVKISTANHSLKPYKLTETGTNNGIFTGEVILTGFLHDTNGDGKPDTNPRTMGRGPTNGFLETTNDGGITISFEFADGVVLTHSALIRWNIGEVSFMEPTYFVGDSAKIQVIDPDMNLNPEIIDQVDLKVTSHSDAAGIVATATETNEASGIFEAAISFTQSSSSSGNRLFANPGDILEVKYRDYTLPRPYSISDDLEITSLAKFTSNIPPIERISITNNFIADSSGNVIQELKTNDQIQVVGAIQNNQNFGQGFIFIVQINSPEGTIVSLSWVEGELQSNQILELSQSWTPSKAGEYIIETFVWSSLKDPIPLSPVVRQSYYIQ